MNVEFLVDDLEELAEAEIAARYRDRFALARDQVSRLERLHVNGPREIGRAHV